MNWFPLKLQFFLYFALSCLVAFGQNNSMKGHWQPENVNYPQLQIVSSSEGIRIIATGGFLKEPLEAVRFQQVASTTNKQLQVVFPGNDANILLNLYTMGENLRATWSRPGVSGKYFRTMYRREIAKTGKATFGAGTIKGHPTGKAKSTASIFQVSLYGPNSERQFLSTQSLGKNGGFNFDGLIDGVYWLYIEPRGTTVIEAYPAMKKVYIKDGNATVVNIELK